jgi:membrane-bound lytic murein transglycosylase C
MKMNVSQKMQTNSQHPVSRVLFRHLALCCLAYCLITLTLGNSLIISADMSDDWDKETEKLEKAFDHGTDNLERAWDALQAQQENEWEQRRRAVAAKWDSDLMPTREMWVDYSDDLNTRSRVDFEKGIVTIETALPAVKAPSKGQVEANIRRQAKKLMNNRSLNGNRILDGQIMTQKGTLVVTANEDPYIKKEIVPQIKAEPKPEKSADGQMRKVYRAQIKLIPNHLKVRAQKFLPVVKKYAERFDVNPQLVLSVIHTESYFNPMARSGCNAIGLMQVIPRYAGREAYRYIYKKDVLIKADHLLDPDQNIELGTAYLHLLESKYFGDYPRNPKNRYLTICGYNWGPGAMNKRIVIPNPIHAISDGDVFQLLKQKTPKETQDYLEHVTSRMPIYDVFFK